MDILASSTADFGSGSFSRGRTIGTTPTTFTLITSTAAITCATRTIRAFKLPSASSSKHIQIPHQRGDVDADKSSRPGSTREPAMLVSFVVQREKRGGNHAWNYLDRLLDPGTRRCVAPLVA